MSNKLLLIPRGSNTTSDDDLRLNWKDSGINVSEIAYSNRLNAILRQLTSVTIPLVDLYLDNYPTEEINSSDKILTEDRLDKLFTKMIKDHAWEKITSRSQNTVLAAPTSGNGNASFRKLAATDIPDLDAAKIKTGTFGNARIAANAILEANIKDDAVTVSKLAANSVTDVKILNGAVTNSKLADATISYKKLSTDILDNNNYIAEARTNPLYRSVMGKVGISDDPAEYTIRKVTVSQWNSIKANADSNTLYFVV